MSVSAGSFPPRATSDCWAALGLATVAALLFPGALRGLTFAAGDLQPLFLGQLDSFVASLRQGSWPVWDPLFGFGQPLWANPGNQILYPPTWLNLLVLPETYLTLYVVGHALLGGLGAWALARHGLGFSAWAAWLAAAGWMCSGPFLSLVQRWQHFAAGAWLPWVILAADRGVERPSTRRVLGLAFVLALQWLVGSVEIAAATLVVAASWSAVRAGALSRSRVARAWLPAVLAAAALTASMWMPALDLLSRSGRARIVGADSVVWSVHPWRWIELVTPLRPDEILLRPELRERLFGWAGTTIVPSLYLGAAAAGLVICALVASPRRRLVAGLAVLALVCGLGAMGAHLPPVAWVTEQVPMLSIVRFPGKLTLFVAFACALLAGLGLDAWRARVAAGSVAHPVLPYALAVAAVPALGFALVASAFPGLLARTIVPPPPPGARVWDVVSVDALMCVAAVGAAAVALLATVLARRSPRWAARGTALIALVAVGDLALPNRRVNPMVPSGLLGRPPETAQRLHADGATRVHAIENEPRAGQGLPRRSDLDPAFPLPPPEALALGLNLALSGRSSSRWGLAGSFTMDALVAPTREQLELSGLFNAVADQPLAVRLLQAGAVSHVVARSVLPEGLEPLAEVPSPLAAPIRLFRVPSPLPRSYVVGAVTTGSDEEALRFVLHSGEERRRTAVLADGQALQGAAAFSGTARVVRFAPDEVEVEVDAPSVACLVLVEAYDPGWSASVDGQPTRVHRANYGFRAVRVPAGRHSVRLRYWPRGLTPGLVVSGLALVGSLVALGFEKRLAAG